jgi:hypothetical protein
MKVPGVISARITAPTPEQVRDARKAAKLTMAAAGLLVSATTGRGDRAWQPYEIPFGKNGHRTIPLAVWELFLLLTNQHPTLKVVSKKASDLANQTKEQITK